MCFLITGFSNLFANESDDRRFVYRPSDSKTNWLRMIVNLNGNYLDGLYHLEGDGHN